MRSHARPAIRLPAQGLGARIRPVVCPDACARVFCLCAFDRQRVDAGVCGVSVAATARPARPQARHPDERGVRRGARHRGPPGGTQRRILEPDRVQPRRPGGERAERPRRPPGDIRACPPRTVRTIDVAYRTGPGRVLADPARHPGAGALVAASRVERSAGANGRVYRGRRGDRAGARPPLPVPQCVLRAAVGGHRGSAFALAYSPELERGRPAGRLAGLATSNRQRAPPVPSANVPPMQVGLIGAGNMARAMARGLGRTRALLGLRFRVGRARSPPNSAAGPLNRTSRWPRARTSSCCAQARAARVRCRRNRVRCQGGAVRARWCRPRRAAVRLSGDTGAADDAEHARRRAPAESSATRPARRSGAALEAQVVRLLERLGTVVRLEERHIDAAAR